MSGQKHFPVSSAYSTHNNVQIIRGGHSYFSLLLQLIEQARHSIHLQTYIFDDDETGTQVAASLIKAAQRGVRVFLLLDGYASQNISNEFISKLKASGIHFRWFEPIFRSRYFYFGRRLHQKIFVADAMHSLVGGINISNRYNDMPGSQAWLDWALYCKGEVSAELFNLCVAVWNKSGWGKLKQQVLTDEASVHLHSEECLVRVRRNDWVRRKNQINRTYIELFKKAESHMIIMSSYFLPGRVFRKHMANAVKRGVKITVVAAGTSDVAMAKHAERYLYRWMFRNKIELYEYQPSILHGKLTTYDSKFVTIGSYNVNNISAFASIELNLDVLNKPFAENTEHLLKEIIDNDCKRITKEEFEKYNSLLKKIWQKVCYEIIRIVFYLFTFYFKQRG